jgi:glycosyltransferase involved in cell wall biosynthesis
MRILALNKYCPKHPLAGGAEKRLREVMRRIAAKGHDVHLVSAMFPGAKRDEFYCGVNIHRIGLKNSDNTVLVHALGVLNLNRFISRIKPDVIFEDISPLPWFSPLLTKKPKVIIVHHINGKVFFESQNFLAAAIAYLLEKSIGLFYRKEKIISISPSTTYSLLKMGIPQKSITEIKDGIDFNEFQKGKFTKFKEPTVLFLGRLEKRKGADFLIRTFDAVKKQVPNVRYIIAGNGKEKKHLEKMAEGTERIIFPGFVKGINKIELLKKSWILAVPSRTEGYGISVLEAACCETPSVANSVPGLSDSVMNNKTGILANCRDNKDFSEKIIALLKDKKKRAFLGRNARAFAKLHSWESCSKETLSLLKEAAE